MEEEEEKRGVGMEAFMKSQLECLMLYGTFNVKKMNKRKTDKYLDVLYLLHRR